MSASHSRGWPVRRSVVRLLLTLTLGGVIGGGVALGCLWSKGADETSRRMEVQAVEGKLLVNGWPGAHAMVTFHPLDVPPDHAAIPVGVTESDGTFKLMTYTSGDGAPVGTYAVTIILPDHSLPVDECVGPLAHDRFKGKYADPALSPWRIVVQPGQNEVLLETVLPIEGWSLPRLRDLDAAKKQSPQ